LWNDHSISRFAQVSGSSEDWARLKAAIDAAPPETGYVLLRTMGERLPLTVDPETAIESSSDVLGLITAGAALMARATRIRGLDLADQVNEERWAPYLACRQRAEETLRSALELNPESGMAAAWFTASAVDADDEVKSEAEQALRRALNAPVSGYSKLLSANTEKWGGSHARMWKVAREFASIRQPWTQALIAKAHYEQVLYLEMMDERLEAAAEAERYFKDAGLRDELAQISQAITTTVPHDPYDAVYAHDVLAAVLADARMRKAASAHLRRVGRFGDPALLTGGPWWQRSLRRIINGLPLW
jgi:tetratricopeptide (TPR) repeat protein